MSEKSVRLSAVVTGHVQGVGFRWWARFRALELGLVGQAENLPDGRVRIEAEGPRQDCEQLVELLRDGGTPGSVDGVEVRYGAADGSWTGFRER